MRVLSACAAIGAFSVFAAAAGAGIVTVNFSGQIDTSLNSPLGIEVGDTFSGSLSYDAAAAPDFVPDAFNAAYSSTTGFSVTFDTAGGPVLVTTDTFDLIQVKNDEPPLFGTDPIDAFTTGATRSSDGVAMSFLLSGAPGPLGGTALPTDLFSPGDWKGDHSLSLNLPFTGSGFPPVAGGPITSMTTVPAPGAVTGCLALIGLATRRRRSA